MLAMSTAATIAAALGGFYRSGAWWRCRCPVHHSRGATLALVVNGLGNLEAVLPAASALAKRHVAYGAKAEHYPVVGAALLWTLEKGLGDGWTPDIAAAWTTAYGTLSGFMISEAYGNTQAAE